MGGLPAQDILHADGHLTMGVPASPPRTTAQPAPVGGHAFGSWAPEERLCVVEWAAAFVNDRSVIKPILLTDYYNWKVEDLSIRYDG